MIDDMGIYLEYLTVSIIEICLLFYFFKEQPRRYDRSIFEISGYMGLISIDIILNFIKLNADIKLAVIISAIFIVIRKIYAIKFNMTILMVFAFIMLLITSEFFAFTIMNAATSMDVAAMIDNSDDFNTIGMLIAKSINLILVILAKKIFLYSRNEINLSELLITLIPCCTNTAVIIFLVDFLKIFDQATITKGTIVIFTALLFLSSASMLILLEKYLERKEQEGRIRLMEVQARNLIEYYQEKESVDERIRRMYHDIRNHVTCLEGLKIMDESSKEYIAALKVEVEEAEIYVSTGKKILDILLKEKFAKMKNFEIDFSSNLDMKNIHYIKDIDLVTIFSNAIDNAIEACMNIKAKERYIRLRSAHTEGFLVVKISNSIESEAPENSSGIKKLKKDKYLHGIGIENIKKSVHKYKGEISIEKNSTEFNMTILFPVV